MIENFQSKGITELRYIDPRKIKKIREIKKKRPDGKPDLTIVNEFEEYFIYNEKGVSQILLVQVLRLLQTQYHFVVYC